MKEISEMGRPECIKGKRMKNIKIAMLVLVVCLSSFSFAFAQVENDTDGKIVKTHPPPKKDCPSEETCELWKEFKGKYGMGWHVRWNEYTGTPKKIYGYHYDMGMGEVTSESKAVSIAKEVIEDNEVFLRAVSSELKLDRIQNDSSGWIIDYRQLYNSVPVYNGKIRVLLTNNGELNGILNNFYPNITLSTMPTISEGKAIKIAKAAYENEIKASGINVKESELKILPKTINDSLIYYLAWDVSINSKSPIWGKRYFVDALEGAILDRQNIFVSVADNTGKISPLTKYPTWLGIFILILALFFWRRWK